MVLTFTIDGNQENLKGNPIPYLRMTQGGLRLLKIPEHKIRSGSALARARGIKRYLRWKHYVTACLLAYGMVDGRRATGDEIGRITDGKGKVQLVCTIYFADKRHGDADNIFKGISDSLFANDKYVVGSVDYHYDSKRPRVEVLIQEREDGEA